MAVSYLDNVFVVTTTTGTGKVYLMQCNWGQTHYSLGIYQ